MKKYLITSPATFPAGSVFSLSKEQYSARQFFLQKQGKNYVATQSVQFKAGEVIGYEGEIPKAIADGVQTKAERSKQAEDGAEEEIAE